MFNKKMNPDQHSDTPGNQTPPGAPPLPAQPQERSTPRASGAPAPTESTSASTVLAEGAKFVGKANVVGTFRVEGLAEGEIQASENLVVAKNGQVEATVSTRRAVLNGQFYGKIEASDRVEMQSGSQVKADIKARNMVMEDGVQFRGGCEIGK